MFEKLGRWWRTPHHQLGHVVLAGPSSDPCREGAVAVAPACGVLMMQGHRPHLAGGSLAPCK